MEKKPDEPFKFDLELDLTKDAVLAKALVKDIDERLNKLKKLLREGAENEDFDEYGVLLHGYFALQKILKKSIEKK